MRAIVVYPMNALPNSQMQELEKFIEQSDLSDRQPTFAHYTGQETKEERDRIRRYRRAKPAGAPEKPNRTSDLLPHQRAHPN